MDHGEHVHRRMGPTLFESVHELATIVELQEMQVPARRQVDMPISNHDLGIGFRADIIVKDCLLLEFKTVDDFNAIHLDK